MIMENLTIENLKKIIQVTEHYSFVRKCRRIEIYSDDNLFSSQMLAQLQRSEFDFYVTICEKSGLPKVVVY